MQIRGSHLFVLAFSAVLAVGQDAPSQLVYKPSVFVTAVNHRYPGSVNSVRNVDFANLQYFDCSVSRQFRLRRGTFVIKHDIGGEEISLDHVYYFRPGKTEPERALVEITDYYGGGSSGQDGILLVFKVESGSLIATQQLVYDQQAEGAGTEFNPATGVLTIRARPLYGGSHHHPKSIDIVTFKWTGKGFEEQSHRTVPIKGR